MTRKSFPPLTDERRDLAARNLRLAYHALAKVGRKAGADRDELESAALYGLVRAAARWQEGGAAGWATYCIVSVGWEVRRAATKRPRAAPTTPDELDRLPVRAQEPDLDGGPTAAEVLLSLITDAKQRLAVELVIIEGKRPGCAGKVMGIDHGAARRLVNRGLKAIKAALCRAA